jgi:hypothetical protein
MKNILAKIKTGAAINSRNGITMKRKLVETLAKNLKDAGKTGEVEYD